MLRIARAQEIGDQLLRREIGVSHQVSRPFELNLARLREFFLQQPPRRAGNLIRRGLQFLEVVSGEWKCGHMHVIS